MHHRILNAKRTISDTEECPTADTWTRRSELTQSVLDIRRVKLFFPIVIDSYVETVDLLIRKFGVPICMSEFQQLPF